VLLGLCVRMDASVRDEIQLQRVAHQSVPNHVVQRRHVPVLLGVQALQEALARVHVRVPPALAQDWKHISCSSVSLSSAPMRHMTVMCWASHYCMLHIEFKIVEEEQIKRQKFKFLNGERVNCNKLHYTSIVSQFVTYVDTPKKN
jgi:hypothetical protein